MTPGKSGDLPVQQRRIIRAWCIYDWANSGFATSGGAAIFPVYFVLLFKDALGESATFFGITLTGSSMWGLSIALATIFAGLTGPILGVIADRVPIKKTLLGIYTAAGAFFTVLMFFSAYTAHPWLWFLGMFIMATVGFAGCLIFYNTLLPHIAPRDLMDEVSSRGFAYGYIGGGLLLLAHLVLIVTTSGTDYADLVTRIVIASVGVWWLGWAWWTLKVVPEPHIPRQVSGLRPVRAVSLALGELGKTVRELREFKVIITYLASYLLFNDGIQTVLAISGAFAADTLGIPLVFNMATILIIQFVAAGGAMVFAWLAARITTKGALSVALLGWTVIILLGVAVAPLVPTNHRSFDYQLSYRAENPDNTGGAYLVERAPELGDSLLDQRWREELASIGSADSSPGSGVSAGSLGSLAAGDTVSRVEAEQLLLSVRTSENTAYSISIAGSKTGNGNGGGDGDGDGTAGGSITGGGPDGETAVGKLHRSSLGDGAIDRWPILVRSLLWQPLGLEAEYQWLVLGVAVGMVMGGSQALARSLFAQIAPQTRSGEFFSFFGFMGRISSVVGPILYVVVTGVLDSRVAVLSIMMLIIAGVITLKFVDVAAGVQVAGAEDLRRYAEAGEEPPR